MSQISPIASSPSPSSTASRNSASGSGVEGARAAGDDKRVAGASLGGAQRNAAEVQHGEDVRVGQLVLETEPDDVKLAERGVGLQRDERMTVLAQHRFEIEPGRIRPLGVDVVASVEQVVEQLQTGMRLRDLVDLREGERDAEVDCRWILAHATELVAEIAPRFSHPGEQALIALSTNLHQVARRRGYYELACAIATRTGAGEGQKSRRFSDPPRDSPLARK